MLSLFVSGQVPREGRNPAEEATTSPDSEFDVQLLTNKQVSKQMPDKT